MQSTLMTSEVIVDVQKKDISIALLEDKRLVEFQQEGRSEQYSVGNIYLAKIRKIMPGLNACFVNVGYERDAFLHYLDLGVRYRQFEHYLDLLKNGKRKPLPLHKVPRQPNTEKDGHIQNTVKVGQEVLVQIVKEPISTKGPRVTCEISFAGRYLVLIPFTDKVSVSTKIKSDAERARLKQLMHSIKPKGFGVIIRTVAEGRRVAELDQELRILLLSVDAAVAKIQNSNPRRQGDARLRRDQPHRGTASRPLQSPRLKASTSTTGKSTKKCATTSRSLPPNRKTSSSSTRAMSPFSTISRSPARSSLLVATVTYKHGAYLIIEHTEALHVVDINSGNRSKSPEGQEVNALDVNLGAADELARQLRLRDMGGIIVVDFIDMAQPENRQKLYERMVENMKKDRARHNILPLSKFGLMQITRQRVRPAMDVKVEEECRLAEAPERSSPPISSPMRWKARSASSAKSSASASSACTSIPSWRPTSTKASSPCTAVGSSITDGAFGSSPIRVLLSWNINSSTQKGKRSI